MFLHSAGSPADHGDTTQTAATGDRQPGSDWANHTNEQGKKEAEDDNALR